jgi:hypothetical protein
MIDKGNADNRRHYGRTPGFMGARRAPLQVTMGVNENGRELEG